MARRKELAGIANSLIASFNSRNNEFHGYWAIGLLKSFAVEQDLDPLTFPLLIDNPISHDELLNHIPSDYTDKLRTLLKSQKIPLDFVAHATITIKFTETESEQLKIPRFTYGELYRCFCDIIDDKGNHYRAEAHGHCLPHSDRRESRSNRYP